MDYMILGSLKLSQDRNFPGTVDEYFYYIPVVTGIFEQYGLKLLLRNISWLCRVFRKPLGILQLNFCCCKGIRMPLGKIKKDFPNVVFYLLKMFSKSRRFHTKSPAPFRYPSIRLLAVLRNRAILPRFRFLFRVPIFLSTVPAPVPVPTFKFEVIFSIKTPAGYLDFGFFSRQLHACVGQCPVRVHIVWYFFFATGTWAGTGT